MEKKLDKKGYLKRIILLAWVALVICFIIKFLGGDIFQVASQNKIFVQVCNYADTHLWLNYIISAFYCFVSLYFFTLAILQRTKYKVWELIVVIVTVLAGTAIKVFWSSTAGIVFDCWQFIIMPIVFLRKDFKKYLNILLANVLLIMFQLISMYIKGIETTIVYNSGVLTSFIFGIDVLIMVILYFAYANILNTKQINGEV